MEFWIFVTFVLSIIALIKHSGKIGKKDFEQKIALLKLEIESLKENISGDTKTSEVTPPELQTKNQQTVQPLPVNSPLPHQTITPQPKNEPESRPAVSQPHVPLAPNPLFVFIRDFFTGGNLVFRIGGLVLFLGIVFLVKYVSDRGLFPIEYRLASVGIFSMAMLVLGWILRKKKAQYGLFLQGLSLAIFYLDIFASYRIYHLIPAELTFALLVLTVIFSVILSVGQNNLVMAITGFVGGFMAPILASTGSGNHVALFSYYAILDLGILGVAYFRTWRILNIVGFFFTYGIGTMWGVKYYTPENFYTTEPFILLFFTVFFITTLLFTVKKSSERSNPLDATLVFGVPLMTIFYQSKVLENSNALAIFSIILSFIYILAGKLLWKKYAHKLKLIVEGFLALGIGFFTLAVPLVLSKSATSVVWALEGCGLVWVGLRQNRLLPRLAGFGLVVMGVFKVVGDYLFRAHVHLPFLNDVFLVYFILAVVHLFLAFQYFKHKANLKPGENFFTAWYLCFGQFWWHFIFLLEINRHVDSLYQPSAIVLFFSLMVLLWHFVSAKLSWAGIRFLVPFFYPASVLLLFGLLFSSWAELPKIHYFLALLFGLSVQIFYLYKNDDQKKRTSFLHALNLYSVILFIGYCLKNADNLLFSTSFDGLDAYYAYSDPYIYSFIIALLGVGFVLVKNNTRKIWPFVLRSKNYLSYYLFPLVMFFGWFYFVATKSSGKMLLLTVPYIPIFNVIDLISMGGVLLALLWNARAIKQSLFSKSFHHTVWAITGFSFFVLMNLMLARSVSAYGAINYSQAALLDEPLFQALMSLLWTLSAMSLMLTGTKNGSRILWQVGVGLLIISVLKLVGVDMKRIDSLYRIVAFIGSGVLILVVGYFSPLPPKKSEVKNA